MNIKKWVLNIFSKHPAFFGWCAIICVIILLLLDLVWWLEMIVLAGICSFFIYKIRYHRKKYEELYDKIKDLPVRTSGDTPEQIECEGHESKIRDYLILIICFLLCIVYPRIRYERIDEYTMYDRWTKEIKEVKEYEYNYY